MTSSTVDRQFARHVLAGLLYGSGATKFPRMTLPVEDETEEDTSISNPYNQGGDPHPGGAYY